MGRNSSIALMILSLPLVLGGVAYSTSQVEDLPKVLKAMAPRNYPPLASAAMVKGKVKIEVKIAPTGDVTSAKFVEGHKLLQDISMPAALRWKFAPTEGGKERKAQLIFTFVHWTEREEKERGTTVFVPPYEVEIVGGTVHIERQSSH